MPAAQRSAPGQPVGGSPHPVRTQRRACGHSHKGSRSIVGQPASEERAHRRGRRRPARGRARRSHARRSQRPRRATACARGAPCERAALWPREGGQSFHSHPRDFGAGGAPCGGGRKHPPHLCALRAPCEYSESARAQRRGGRKRTAVNMRHATCAATRVGGQPAMRARAHGSALTREIRYQCLPLSALSGPSARRCLGPSGPIRLAPSSAAALRLFIRCIDSDRSARKRRWTFSVCSVDTAR
jgi:hypothetical protein